MAKILELFSMQEQMFLIKMSIHNICLSYYLELYIFVMILTIMEEYKNCFGEVYLFLNNNYLFYAKAIKDPNVLLITKELFNIFFVLSNHLNTILAKKVFVLSIKLVLIVENTLRDKIINYVVNNANVKMKRYKMVDENILEI